MTKRSYASRQKLLNPPQPKQATRAIEAAKQQERPVGHKSVTRSGLSHYIRLLPLEGVRGISHSAIKKKIVVDVAKLPKWEPPSWCPEMTLMDYEDLKARIKEFKLDVTAADVCSREGFWRLVTSVGNPPTTEQLIGMRAMVDATIMSDPERNPLGLHDATSCTDDTMGKNTVGEG